MKLKGLWVLGVLLAGCANRGSLEQGSVDGREAGICALEIRGERGWFGRFGKGTGVVVGGRSVITVAHNLLDEELGRVTAVKVRGAGGGMIGEGQGWSVSSGYLVKQSGGGLAKSDPGLLGNDFGFVDLGSGVEGGNVFRLDRTMGAAVGKGDVVRVAGYGEGKNFQESAGRVTRVAGSLFGYEGVTEKGMSGSPVWVERKGERILVGIHVGSDLAGFEGAVARRIDRGLIEEFNRWVVARRGRE